MKKLLAILILFIIAFYFTGCTSVNILPKTPESAEVFPPYYYREKALEYEKKDELQMALFHMKIAGTLSPEDKEISERIADLKSTIAYKSNQHFKKGVVFYKKGKIKSARKHFLITLRYNPNHKEALGYLKSKLTPKEYTNYKVKKKDTLKSISRQIYKDPGKDFLIAYFNNLKTDAKLVPETTLKLPILKSEFTKPLFDISAELIKAENLLEKKKYEEVLSVAGKILEHDKSNKAAEDLINTTCCQNGKGLIVQKNYAQALKVLNKADPGHGCIKKALFDVKKIIKKQAEVHYLRGVKHFLNEELKDAIKEWEKTLALDPEYKKAETYIQNAKTLLEKLKKVK